MSKEILEQFQEISEKVKSNQISVEEGVEKIKTLDFNKLSFDEIETFEDSDWIPDDIYVDIIRGWISIQEQNLTKIRSYLFVSKIVGKDKLIQFIDAIFNPSNVINTELENIIYLLATGGGRHEYENPMTNQIITASSNCALELPNFKLVNLFSGNPNDFFQSKPFPNANLLIEFPPFIQISMTSYKLQAPPKAGGPQSWVLQGSNDKVKWNDLDNRICDRSLMEKSAISVFQLQEKAPPYRFFLLTQKDTNHAKNLQLILSTIDFNGELILTTND
ncbi:F5/8 type C domain containing protein [Histomonas meleagridis]|uniref:F5/8 type C domain containing protein n=1 Tax=Histomonas meleagridis TaxID=135588 RepID=UPI00355A4AE6|nr:F5/8 type C domain containing protein [Histomonas meleagridis]KAH0797529.1 F5/8 type C domain containing protein [Histomonas meleagridis]